MSVIKTILNRDIFFFFGERELRNYLRNEQFPVKFSLLSLPLLNNKSQYSIEEGKI
jgi:hypothetical protein